MPFTISHAVVALPFRRTPLVVGAIAVGAMTPDLPLFLRGTPIDYGWTHSLAWLPLTTLLALALLLVWRCVLRPAVRPLVPAALARRLPAEWDGGVRAALRETFASTAGVLLLVLSLALGVASHVAWDAFTHEGRAGVALIPALDVAWGPFTGYKWLQHASSAIGLVLLAAWMLHWVRRAPVGPPVPRVVGPWVPVALGTALPAILAAAWGAGWWARGPFTDLFTPAHLAYLVLPPACAAWGVLLVAVCLAVAWRRRALLTADE